uniref:Translation initiation factor eIF-4E n=1 Tax=Philodina roseola TaxID=96448 RepID=B5AHC0_PHIRO|nr:translation initiation factor eIF-4E [Philodina roseola]
MDEFSNERNDSQSDDLYTTPISPLSPQEKSPPVAPLPLLNINFLPEQIQIDFNHVKEMQNYIQSSDDLTFPLQDSWTFWYFKNDRMSDWKDNLINITTVTTVESFWAVFNHLQVASRLGQGCDYFLFKSHIQPMWEDAYNRTGGRWSLNLNKNQRANELDRYWLNTLLSLIGDQYSDADYVNGCVVSVRSKGDRISLWTRDWRHAEVTKRIGNRFREVADISRSYQLIFEVRRNNDRMIIIWTVFSLFQSHDDQESKRGPSSKILFRA